MGKEKQLTWNTFTRAAQAQPGAKMRPIPTIPEPGRPRSYTVLRREQRPYMGNIIYFEDGSNIKVSDAKGGWLVQETI